ncbi:MAG: response regulator transcription factor [Epsilonproteobacteria bacterium]|nr:response regulator transcription factor [Campylobacterota bacterium]
MIDILLLEDDEILGETIQEILMEAKYRCVWAKDGVEAAEFCYDHKFDLYIFDVNVPQMNGFELLNGLRDAEDATPTIFISAMTDIKSITKGFEVGAEDYIKKPFFPQELLLKIEARFHKKQKTFELGEILFEQQTNKVFKNSQEISLGDVQLALLRIFINNIGATISKETLLDCLEHPSDVALRVAINKLKQTTHWKILNIRSIGYRLEKS